SEAVVRFETRRSEEGLGEVLRHLVRDGILVSQFRELRSDLEDAFLSVTSAADVEPASAVAG
ncbi:MAG: ABC transporter ATP-binding protein, partial [Planctomycetes bacterium]|nr:ABC transporter ATP-binding protein [Planctomycetota bacterium]